MKAIIVYKNITMHPARFGMRVYALVDDGSHKQNKAEFVTLIEDTVLAAAGSVNKLEFDWPFEGASPGHFRYKAAGGLSLVFQIVQFDVGTIQVLRKGGLLA
jgi:hypothetical protein